MTIASRALRCFALLTAVLPVYPAMPSAGVVAQRKGAPRAGVPKPVAADNGIIPLPLNPIVPAAQRICAVRTPSGLGYTMLRPAIGPKPAADATVLVNYIGYLAATGAMFDQGMQSALPVGGVIPGFAEGLQLAVRSGVVRLCIPAALGYGAQGSGPIPANSDLVFQVELLDFKTAAQLDELRKAQAGEPAAQKHAVSRP